MIFLGKVCNIFCLYFEFFFKYVLYLGYFLWIDYIIEFIFVFYFYVVVWKINLIKLFFVGYGYGLII